MKISSQLENNFDYCSAENTKRIFLENFAHFEFFAVK